MKTTKSSNVSYIDKNIPKVMWSMPDFRIYHRGKPILVMMRSLKEYKDESILVVPFTTDKLEYYGSANVNYSEVNYRSKLRSKKDMIEVSQPYVSGEKGNAMFEKFCFIKVTEDNIHEDFKKGFRNISILLNKNKQIKGHTIVIAFDQKLGPLDVLIEEASCLIDELP